MAGFRGGAAVASGFRLAGREPLALAAWAGVYLILGILPQIAIWPKMMKLMEATRGAADPRLMAELSASMAGYQPVIWLCTLLMFAVLYGAIYRAVLEPENRRYFYLRLGMQELWMLLSSAVLLVLAIVAILVTCVPLIMIGEGLGHGAAPALLAFLVGLAVFLLFFWLAMRFAMVAPMAWAQRRFVLMDSWRMTKGHGVKMIGVALAIIGIVIAVELVVGGIFLVALYPAINGGGAGIAKVLGDPSTLLTRWAPWIVIAGILSALLVAAGYAVLVAPWASIYSDLSSQEPSDETAG